MSERDKDIEAMIFAQSAAEKALVAEAIMEAVEAERREQLGHLTEGLFQPHDFYWPDGEEN